MVEIEEFTHQDLMNIDLRKRGAPDILRSVDSFVRNGTFPQKVAVSASVDCKKAEIAVAKQK